MRVMERNGGKAGWRVRREMVDERSLMTVVLSKKHPWAVSDNTGFQYSLNSRACLAPKHRGHCFHRCSNS